MIIQQIGSVLACCFGKKAWIEQREYHYAIQQHRPKRWQQLHQGHKNVSTPRKGIHPCHVHLVCPTNERQENRK